MKLLIDTSLPKMLFILMDCEKIIFKFATDTQKKADLLPEIFEDMLQETKINIKEIKEFYVTSGSGSFMGSRTAITFARTIAQLTNAKFFVADSLAFVGFKSKIPIYLDAKSGQSYEYDPLTKNTKLVNFQEDSKIIYEEIIENIFDYFGAFKEINPDEAKAFYLKEPKIGEH